MDMIEKTVKTNYVYRGKILSLRNDDALLPDGNPCKREIVEHSGGACVLYVENNSVLLVKQYRYAYGEMLYEIPAGKLEQGEEPKWTAIRELEEETGYKAKSFKHLTSFATSPAILEEIIHVYLATELTKGEKNPDDGEFVEMVKMPLNEAKKMIFSGEIDDGKTIIGILLTLEYLKCLGVEF